MVMGILAFVLFVLIVAPLRKRHAERRRTGITAAMRRAGWK